MKKTIRGDSYGTGESDYYNDELVNEVVDDLFHIGQCYEEEAVKTLQCVKCGSKEFNVGQGSYYTAIRCPKCRWEHCIHDG